MDKTPRITQLDALDANGETKASFTIGTDVLDYIEPARTFGRDDLADPSAAGRFQARMIALPDRRNASVEPMVLTLGKGQRLALVRRTGEASAGWESIAVARDVMAFSASWAEIDGEERITVAVAVNDNTAGKAVSRLLVAYDLDASQTDWSALPWTDYGTRNDMAIDAIRLHREPDRRWTVVLSAIEGGKQDVWLVRDDRAPSLQQALVFTVPSELKETLALDLGSVGDDATLFALGVQHSRDALALFTRRMPGSQMSPTGVHPFACPPHAHVLSLGAPSTDGSDLYVGGHGVHLLGKDEFFVRDPQFEEVIAPEHARNIRQLSVCENAEGATSVWALQADGQLLMTCRANAGEDWNPSLMVRSDITELAPVMGDDHLTAGVLLVYRDGHAGHLWRDAQGTWQESEIRVADPQGSATTTCFATNVVICDENGFGLPLSKVTLRASVLSTLVVNGRSVTTGPDTPIRVTTDAQGSLRIFNRALSFAPALYRIDVDACGQALEVNPAATLYSRFDNLSVAELQAARCGDKPLLADGYRSAEGARTLEALVSALKQASLLLGEAAGPARLVQFGSGFETQLGRHLAPTYAWGVASDGKGRLSSTAAPQALAIQSSDEALQGGLGESLSDLLEGLWARARSAVSSAFSFVIRKAGDAIEFVCEIAGKVRRFVLDTLQSIGSFFKNLWEGVGTAAQEVWTYLKFLYDWEDIRKVRQYMIDNVDRQFGEMLELAERMKGNVAKGFDGVQEKLRAHANRLGINCAGQPVPGKPKHSLVQEHPKEEHNKYEVTRSGPAAWINDLLNGIISAFVVYEAPDLGDSHQKLEQDINQHLDELKAAFKSLGINTKEVFGPEGFKLAELDFEKIEKLVLSLLFNIADVAVRVLKAVVTGLLTALQGLITSFRVLLFSKIRFPFMEKTFALLSGGKTIDTSFRIIDVVMWPAAVLTTLTCKLALGEEAIELLMASDTLKQDQVTARFARIKRWTDLFRDIALNAYGVVTGLLKASLLTKGVVPKAAMNWYEKIIWAGQMLQNAATRFFPTERKLGAWAETFLSLSWLAGMTQLTLEFFNSKNRRGLDPSDNIMVQVGAASAAGALIAMGGLFWILSYWADDESNPWLLAKRIAYTASGVCMQACIIVAEPVTKALLYSTGLGLVTWFAASYVTQQVIEFKKMPTA